MSRKSRGGSTDGAGEVFLSKIEKEGSTTAIRGRSIEGARERKARDFAVTGRNKQSCASLGSVAVFQKETGDGYCNQGSKIRLRL